MTLIDTDVEILHEIITTAQQSSYVDSLPFRAVFAAYDQVLVQHGLDSNHDQVYLRFLFRLGDKRETGKSLYEAFEAVLLELGIQLLFSTEEEGSQEVDATNNTIHNSAVPDVNNAPRGRSRRASFNSYYDAENESTRANQLRYTSGASLSRLPRFRSTTRATTRPTERVFSQRPPSEILRTSDSPGRLISREFLSNFHHYGRPRNDIMRDGGRQASYKPKNEECLQEEAAYGSQQYDSESYDSSERSDEKVAIRTYPAPGKRQFTPPQDILYRPSETQLLRDADTFQYFRTRSVAGDALRKWRTLAVEACHIHHEMECRAAACDANTLLRQAYDQWQTLFQARKHRAELEKYFDNLEQKAGKARDRYLLTKALTHWVQCTYEEVERASFARRNILRTRYFRSWLDITVVNKIKIRRQRLKKFVLVWRHKYELSNQRDAGAVAIYYTNLVETIYWRWFWSFCERRAPVWKDGRLKRRYFVQCLLIHQVDAQKTFQATLAYEKKSKRRYFDHWLEKIRKFQLIKQQSQDFSETQLKKTSLSAWRLQLKYLPFFHRISGMVNWRIASSNFSTLMIRFKLERHAEQVNHGRVVRNAWTHWNDRLRWQTLARQINDRLLVEALYKWVLTERFTLLERLCQERMERRALNTIVRYFKSLRSHHNETCQSIVESRDRTLLQLALRSWQGQLQANAQNDRLAFEFRAPKTTQKYLHTWTTSCKHCQQLQTWSRNATFYFRGSRTLKRWQMAVSENQSQKRRNAYVSVRRAMKMNLARRILHRWQEQANHIFTLRQIAQELGQKRTLVFATSMFDCWRDRLHFSIAENLEASRNFGAYLVYQYLQLWVEHLRDRGQDEAKAQEFALSHVQKIAYDNLRALQLKVFEHRSRNKTAADLKAWNEKHHHQSFLRIWREETDKKRGATATDFTRSYRSRRNAAVARLPIPDNAGASDAGPEDWLALDNEFEIGDWIPTLEAQRSLTPIPGYLSTPSKRAARARAIVRGGNTPASPVSMRTPLLRKLHTQPATESRLGPGGLGRSVRRFRPSGFENLTQRESQTP